MENTLHKLLLVKKKEHINKMWGIMDDLGWGIKHFNIESMTNYLNKNYSDNELRRLDEFISAKRKDIIETLHNHSYKMTGNPYGYYGVSDDGFWDLTAHIVGLGRYWYEKTMNDPEIARTIASHNMYKENFQYVIKKTDVIERDRQIKWNKKYGTPITIGN